MKFKLKINYWNQKRHYFYGIKYCIKLCIVYESI